MPTNLPRVNFLGIIAGILALISIILPWWGITATRFGSTTSSMWGFFGGPSRNPDINNASGFSSTIVTYGPIILALVLLTTALAIAGSFTTRFRFLAGSLVTSVAALVGYAELIGYTVSNNCQGAVCVTSPTGSESIVGVTLAWLSARILPLHWRNHPSCDRTSIPSTLTHRQSKAETSSAKM